MFTDLPNSIHNPLLSNTIIYYLIWCQHSLSWMMIHIHEQHTQSGLYFAASRASNRNWPIKMVRVWGVDLGWHTFAGLATLVDAEIVSGGLLLESCVICVHQFLNQVAKMSREWSNGLFSCFEDFSTCKVLQHTPTLATASDHKLYYRVLDFFRRYHRLVLSMLCVR